MARYHDVAERQLLCAQAKMLEHKVRGLTQQFITHAKTGVGADEVKQFSALGDQVVEDIEKWKLAAVAHFNRMLEEPAEV